MNEYKKLDKSLTEDIELLRELASAINEYKALKSRMEYLQNLIVDNEEYKNALWTTQQGKTIPISDVEDSHLKNIAIHLVNRGASNKRIYKEIVTRFGFEALPSGLKEDDEEDEEDDYDDIYKPF